MVKTQISSVDLHYIIQEWEELIGGKIDKIYSPDNKENIILFDARNNYEFDIGRFKDAMHLDLDTFRQFPMKIKELQGNNKKNNIKNENNKKNNNLKNNKLTKIKILNLKYLKNKKI